MRKYYVDTCDSLRIRIGIRLAILRVSNDITGELQVQLPAFADQ